MPKTIKHEFDKCLTFKKMLEAHERAKVGKSNKSEIIIFEMDLENNIIKIIDDIKYNRYKFGEYREFKVYEPKERIIKSLPYRDRIVHQWFVEEFIKPYYYPRFINDTYACLDLRGTHKAVESLQIKMRKMQKKHNEYYVLKCDIRKYFYSIDKNILIKILSKKISDKKVLNFAKVILNDGVDIGIPIGNYTSQYFANIYLNELDHFVKEELRVKNYIRYMDDFIILVKEKEEARKLYYIIQNFINSRLNLQFNSKSSYFKSRKGIDFCGYRIYETHILLRKRFKNKVNKSIRTWNYLYNNNKLYYDKFIMSWNSYKGHASHSNSFNFISNKSKKIICLNTNETK